MFATTARSPRRSAPRRGRRHRHWRRLRTIAGVMRRQVEHFVSIGGGRYRFHRPGLHRPGCCLVAEAPPRPKPTTASPTTSPPPSGNCSASARRPIPLPVGLRTAAARRRVVGGASHPRRPAAHRAARRRRHAQHLRLHRRLATLLLAVDQPGRAKGEIFNAADDVPDHPAGGGDCATELGHEWGYLGHPPIWPDRHGRCWRPTSRHRLFDTSKLRTDSATASFRP